MARRLDRVVAGETRGEILARFCLPVRAWWEGRFATLTAPQELAIPAIHERRHTLVCAPTGSGKTLCAFISVLDELFRRHEAGTLGAGIECLYVSPLKALGADITRNLLVPLTEIAAAMGPQGASLKDQGSLPIRIAQRTGDTSASERGRLARRPPHILVTTPESLALCLAQGSMREHLRQVRTIIIDELHSVAGNKRGVDLAVSIERLSTLAAQRGGEEPVRIGLSATIAPLEAMAEFLVGAEGAGRSCAIADAAFDRGLDLEVRAPFAKTPFAKAGAISKRVYDLLEELIRSHRTVLVFTNMRGATERVTYGLRKRFPENPESIQAHHSSLDRELRLAIEQRLKEGQLKCVVCSTSLELGIDIGSIDRVVLLNSPKGVSRGLQRVGRSGHSHGATARGTFIPTVPADVVECLVTAQMMRGRRLEAIAVPRNCLDVLAQQLIGMAVEAGARGVGVEEAYELFRRTMPYGELARGDFEACVAYLATPAGQLPPKPGAKLEQDGVRLRLLRKGLAGLYAQNVGTIASEGTVRVKLRRGKHEETIGTLQEAFAQMLKPGDRFILAGRCVAFVEAQGMMIYVVASEGQQPTVPRWYGEMMAMGEGLSREMREFRAKVRGIAPAGVGAIAHMLSRQWAAGEEVAGLAAEFLLAQFRYADIPTAECLLIERVPDEDAIALIFHTMIGRAGNEAIARLVAYRLHRYFGGNATVVVDDYAFGVWVPQSSGARRADRTLIRSLLSPVGFGEDLAVAVGASELFRAQFRFTALRAHAILQNRFSRRAFLGQMQGYATRLHETLVAHCPEHILLRETRRTIMEDVLCAPLARGFLERQQGLGLRLLDLPSPSPFAFGLFATSRRDTLQLADTSDFLLAMYEQVQRRLAAEEERRAGGVQRSLF